MKTSKIKIGQNQQEIVRAKLYRPDDKVFKSLKVKLEKNGNSSSWSYQSFESFPSGIKILCEEVFGKVDDGIKINANVYPPECLERIKVGSMSDKVGIFMMGCNGVIKCEINPTLLGMAQINIPKDAALKTKEVHFHPGGSHFTDGYPFSLVSDYVEQHGRYTLGGLKGGRPKTINIPADRRGRWVIVLSQTAGKKTIERIVKTVKDITGKDIDTNDITGGLLGGVGGEDEVDERIANLADDL